MNKLFILLIVISFQAIGQSFNTFPVQTQKPPLHGKNWMAITGKPLAATAGAMIFTKGGNAIDASCAMLASTCTMWDVLSWGRGDPGVDLQSQNQKSYSHKCPWRGPYWCYRGFLQKQGL